MSCARIPQRKAPKSLMASILGGFALAREGAFFKKEQEADLQRYVEYLKQRGVISDDTGNRSPPRHVSLDKSLQSYEMLGEILQQGARLNVPRAALMQEYEKRAKAKLPPLTEAEFRRWRSQLGIAGSVAVGVGTNLRLQPNRYASLSQGLSRSKARSLSPEAAEAARRQFMVAMRGLVYGSVIGGILVFSLGSYVCWRYDLRGMEDVKMLVKKSMLPMGHSLQERLRPLKEWARGWTNRLKVKTEQSTEAPLRYETEFSRALKKKFNNGRSG